MTSYARAVRDGTTIAGPHVRDACARHLRDLEELPAQGFHFDVKKAQYAIDYFAKVLRLNGGDFEGKPFVLQPSQCFIVGSVYGWLGPSGYRRFRVAYVEEAKGNGKSPLGAGLGLLFITADGEARAEAYAAATKRDQAMVAFRDAVAMVDQSPQLRKRIIKSGRNDATWNLYHEESGSFFRPISSDENSQSGPRPHFVLIDEFHEARTSHIAEMTRAGTKGRKQALQLFITNSGFDRTSPCFERHMYATKVAAGDLVDESFFSYVCAIDPEDDPFTDPVDEALGVPRSWMKTNPLLGVTIQKQYIEEQVREAKGMPGKESIVRRLNFCQWVDAENPWIEGDLWRKCERKDLDISRFIGRRCYLALDLSSTTDLCACAAVWPDDEGGADAAVWFWTPKDTLLKRAHVDRVPYDAWERDGHLMAVKGRALDYAWVVKFMADHILSLHDVRGIAFDPWHWKDFLRELDEAGIDCHEWEGPNMGGGVGLPLVRHGQGFGGGASESALWMPRSVTALEGTILRETLRVRWNPVLTWNSASAVLESDPSGNRKFEKRKSTGRIDGLVALCMAHGLALELGSIVPGQPGVILLNDDPTIEDDIDEEWNW